ncbi:MAG: hypothetical protein ACKVKF_04635 [Rhodobacterales bacterium]|nr:SGNH/GDSL hydrolase family protein [Puniceibacterium antarcticum]
MIGAGLGLGRHFAALLGGIPAAPPPVAAPALLPASATSRWHPAFSEVTTSGGRLVTASDLAGLAALSAGGPGIGPKAMTDGQGHKFWRFEGSQFLNVAGSLVCSSRDMSVFMVGRVPRHPPTYNRFLSMGNVAQGTQVNTLGGPLESRVVSQSAGHVQSFGKLAYTAASGSEWLVPGAQKQVIGAAAAAGGTRLFLNERFVDVAVALAATGVGGAEIGRYAWSPGTSGGWGVFDLYEMVVFSPGLANAAALAVSEALMSAHGIVPVQHQLILEGDSITQGTGDVSEALSCAAILTNPGTTWVPPGWRVINKGISGNQVGDLVIKRDTANGWATQKLPGQNVLAFEIGRNDWVAGGKSAAQHYANVVSYLNTATTGVLQRGWTVRAMANIAGTSGLMPVIEAHRASLRSPQFLTDTASGAGQAFAGRVSIVSTDLIGHNGDTRLLDSDDASDTTYYAGDSTHPGPLGAEIRVTGGETPQYAVAAGL